MRGIVEAAAKGDLRYGLMGLGGTRKIDRGAVQSTLANIMGETVARALEQFLEVALRDPLDLGDARRCEIRVVEPALDRLADAVKQRRLTGRSARLDGSGRRLACERQQQFGQALVDRRPIRGREGVEVSGGGVESRRQHAGQPHGGYEPGRAEVEGPDPAAAERCGRYGQGRGTDVPVEDDLPVARPGQQGELSCRDSPTGPVGQQRRPVFMHQEQERQIGPLRARRQCLRTCRQPGKADALRRPTKGCSRVTIERVRGNDRAQTERADQVLPRRTTTALGIGLARELAKTHAGP